MAKERVPVPEEIAGRVLFLSDHTCCKCREPGRPIQLHHINEDPADNAVDNLAVLCLLCHSQTQAIGGFGRALGAAEVRQFRDDWTRRVHERRGRADQLLISQQAGAHRDARNELHEEAEPPAAALLPYVSSLPAALAAAYKIAKPKWNAGSTAESLGACSDVIGLLKQMLVHLAAWCGPRHFGDTAPALFFSKHVSARYAWRRALTEAQFVGTMVNQLVAGSVLADLQDDVADLVDALLSNRSESELEAWRVQWARAKETAIE